MRENGCSRRDGERARPDLVEEREEDHLRCCYEKSEGEHVEG